MVKKRIAMTTIYINNYVFPQEYIGSKSAKKSNKTTKKALPVTNLQNMKQCTNYLTVQSYQRNININKLLLLKC